MSTLSVPRIIDVTEVLQRNFTLDTTKNCFVVYFIIKCMLKLQVETMQFQHRLCKR